MNIIGNERMLDKLAAEYVLGTLKGGARRRFEGLWQTEPQVRRITAQWQDRLHPIAQFTPAVTPPPQLWQAIASRLKLQAAGTTARKPSFWRGLRDDLGFWRGLGMASTALATILIAVLATRAPGILPGNPAGTPTDTAISQTSYVAMLADDRAQPVAVVTGDERNHRLTVKVVLPQTIAADRSLELWAVPKSGPPRSLGLVDASGSVSLQLPANTTPQTVALLAISLEPKGGSPNHNAPSGPIVYKGAWLQI